MDNPLYKMTAAQMSLLLGNQSTSREEPEKALEPVEFSNKLIETAEEEKTEPMSKDSEIEPVVSEKTKKQRRFRLHNDRARIYE